MSIVVDELKTARVLSLNLKIKSNYQLQRKECIPAELSN